MKGTLYVVGAVCAAVAGWLIWSQPRRSPVEDLAHRLEDAWADHHTVA